MANKDCYKVILLDRAGKQVLTFEATGEILECPNIVISTPDNISWIGDGFSAEHPDTVYFRETPSVGQQSKEYMEIDPLFFWVCFACCVILGAFGIYSLFIYITELLIS